MANIHLSNSLGRSFPLPFALQYTFELKFEKEMNLSSFHNLLSNIFWAIAHSKSLGAYNSGNGGSISGDECRLALQKMNKDWSGESVNDKRNRDAQKWKGEDSNRRLWKTVAADEPRRGSETGRTPNGTDIMKRCFNVRRKNWRTFHEWWRRDHYRSIRWMR